MNSIFRSISRAACLLGVMAPSAFSQTFDTSGTAGLSGPYLYRYVAYYNDANTGAVTEGCSVSGVITFDGKGAYTTSNTQFYDSAGSNGSCAQPTSGTYGVQSNGIAQLDNPLFSATLFGTFSQPVVSASSTEDDYFDMFVAVQAPTASTANNAFSGAFTLGSLEFQNASNSYARQAWFNIIADGNGGLAAFTLNGNAANLGTGALTQTVNGGTYSFSGNGTGNLMVPLQGSSTAQTQLISGNKVLNISADGNYVIGGSATGLDLIFGFKTAPSGITNAAYSGTYFTAGLANLSTGFFDAFYGSVNANGAGTAIWHERFDDIVDVVTYDSVFPLAVNFTTGGAYNDGTETTLLGNNGQAMMLIGSGSFFSLNIGVKAPAYPQGSGPWINPIGITNAANYTGITNAFAPGELVNIYGNFGVSSAVDSAIPIPNTLNGVQVFVNGTAAPVYFVSANQISALIPYALAGQSFGTFQVAVNGATSNAVTVYIDGSAPGIYTLGQNGIGPAAILHSNFTVVNSSSPAVPGETVLLFLNGLGPVSPSVADGAAGPSSPLSIATGASTTGIFLYDGVDAERQCSISFAGLAPGFPGLYQVNFTIPRTGLRSGNVDIDYENNESSVFLSTISLSGFAGTATTGVSTHKPAAAKRASSTRVLATSTGTSATAATAEARSSAKPISPRRALAPRERTKTSS